MRSLVRSLTPALIACALLAFPGSPRALDPAAPASTPAEPERPQEAPGADRVVFTPSVGPRYYSWTETDGGQELLHETGGQLVLGVDGRVLLGDLRRGYLQLGLQLALGTVDYDGHLQDGTPAKTRTAYVDFSAAPTAGYVFTPAPGVRLAPYGGLAYEQWRRDIADGAPLGYIENWQAFFVQLGARGDLDVARAVTLHGALGVMAPLSISNEVDMASLFARQGMAQALPDVTLHPGTSPRLTAEAGVDLYGLALAVYFETWSLPRSSGVNVTSGGTQYTFYQPDSLRQLFGLRVGYAFGL